MTGEWIDLESRERRSFGAYRARPDGPLPVHGIVLLQEIFGINAFVREAADRWASAGYAVIAPDLFWRQQPRVELNPESGADRARAMDLMKGLNETLALQDIQSAATFLRTSMTCTKVAAIGYCLGGKLAYLAATQPGIDAAVSYYGVAIQSSLDRASSIKAPLLLHLAGDDHLCPATAQEKIVETLKPAGVQIELHPGVGHGFARFGSPIFNDAAFTKADGTTRRFLSSALVTGD